MPTKPSIVFCHGIWADGSSFSKVIPPLQAEGYEVMAAQYGLDTPEGDVVTVKRTLGRVSSPAILVGHSYGGSVITAAGTDERVAGLVYIAIASANAGADVSSTSVPVSPSTIVSSAPPRASATTGRPHACASSGTMPKSSSPGKSVTAARR